MTKTKLENCEYIKCLKVLFIDIFAYRSKR